MPEDRDCSQPKLTATTFLQVIEASDVLADSVNGRREQKEKQNFAKGSTTVVIIREPGLGVWQMFDTNESDVTLASDEHGIGLAHGTQNGFRFPACVWWLCPSLYDYVPRNLSYVPGPLHQHLTVCNTSSPPCGTQTPQHVQHKSTQRPAGPVCTLPVLCFTAYATYMTIRYAT